MTKIAVYCGANMGFEKKYQIKAAELGKWMVKNNYELVYGGGNKGLMGVIASSVLEAGGNAYGVMPKFLVEQEQAYQGLTNLEIVDTMATRKQKMLEMADACLALPGGPGTIEEISEAYSLYRVGQSDNPVIMFNQDNYYRGFQMLYDQMVNQGFLSTFDRAGLFFTDDFTAIKEFLDRQLTQPRNFSFDNVLVNKKDKKKS